MAEWNPRANELFQQAIQLATTAERQAYLNGACGSNADLKQAVETLLKAHDQAGSFLNAPHPAVTGTFTLGDPKGPLATDSYSNAETPGTIIAGKYKLLQQIGEGGMGSVWMADQTEPVKRRVAVKLIRTERGSSKTILARFEAERQAIALMDHPHIAKLLDAGTTEKSSPYFVMELVKGVPLTEFCDAHKLSIQDRLSLFMQICSAVQHAHQKGIIHRDLKPSNILVELHDDKPVPKVIDFGLAKATSGLQLTENTLFTGFGTVAGTPLYMAPEQANFNAVDIDTRADIYAMGVILYELLTGTTPISRETIKKAALEEMMKLIREQEAPTPSSRLSLSDTKPTVAANRHTEPLKLGRYVKGELDWIVMKALSKERDRRYETANGFAKDIERFLNHEAVLAGPVSASYWFKKFVKRNKGKVVAAGLLLSTLILGITGTTWGLLQARSERDRAEVERQNALHERDGKEKARQAEADRAEGERLAKVEAQAARDKEARERSYAEAIAHFVKDDFLALTSVEGQSRFDGGTLTRNATLRELLDRAAEKLKDRKGLAPRTEAELCWIIGVSYRSIGDADRAIPFLERSVELNRQISGPDGEETLNAKNSLAVAYGDAGKNDLAVSLSEENYRLSKAKRGGNHSDTLAMMMNLVSMYKEAGKLDLALPLAEECFKLMKAKVGIDHPATFQSMSNLARTYQAAGKLDLALPLLQETLKLRRAKLGVDDPFTLSSMGSLASGYEAAGKHDLALPIFEETFLLYKKKIGADHPTTLVSMSQLASCYKSLGKLDLALPMFEENLKLTRVKRWEDHPDTINSIGNLGLAYLAAGKEQQALPLLLETVARRKAKFGPVHPVTLNSMNHLAQAYIASRRYDVAIPLLEETLKQQKIKLGAEHLDTIATMNNLALAYRSTEKNELALPLFEEALRLGTNKQGADHATTLIGMNNLALGYFDAKRLDEALSLFEKTLKLQKVKLGVNHSDTLNTMNNLASAYHEVGKVDLAIPLYEQTVQLQKAKLGADHPQTLITMNNLAEEYMDANQFDKSIQLFEESLKLRVAKRGRQHHDSIQTIFKLGVCYKLAGRLAEAIPLLEEAFQASKQRSSLPYASRNLLDAYLLAGKTKKALSFAYEYLADDRRHASKDHAEVAADLSLIGRALLNGKAFLDAEPVLRECLAIREKNTPDEYRTFNTRSALGGALLGQKKYIEAEPFLLKGFQGMKEREKSIPPPFSYILSDALDRLIQLYTDANKPDEVKKWQAVKDKLPKPEPTKK